MAIQSARKQVIRGVSLILALGFFTTSVFADSQRKINDPKLREAVAAGKQLHRICQRAGFAKQDRAACAESMSKHCSKQGIDPTTTACWQWMVQAQAKQTLDYARVFGEARSKKQ